MRLLEEEINDIRQRTAERRGFDFNANLEPLVHNPRMAPQCPVCEDKGTIQRHIRNYEPGAYGPHRDTMNGKTVIYYTKTVPCTHPACPAGKDNRDRKIGNLMRNAGVKKGYRDFSFATWDRIPSNLRFGKYVARLAMQMYVRQNGKPFAMGDLLRLTEQGSNLRQILLKEIEEAGLDMDAQKSGVILAGTNGTGKTGLMASAAMQMLNDGEEVVFINTLELMSDVFEGYDDGNASQKKRVMKQIPHVMLDEMTFEAKDSHRRLLQELTRARYDDGLPILATTNCTAEEFEKLFGIQTASGLFGVCHWIEMWGEPLRHESPFAGGRR